jgi:hypothetical protein
MWLTGLDLPPQKKIKNGICYKLTFQREKKSKNFIEEAINSNFNKPTSQST